MNPKVLIPGLALAAGLGSCNTAKEATTRQAYISPDATTSELELMEDLLTTTRYHEYYGNVSPEFSYFVTGSMKRFTQQEENIDDKCNHLTRIGEELHKHYCGYKEEDVEVLTVTGETEEHLYSIQYVTSRCGRHPNMYENKDVINMIYLLQEKENLEEIQGFEIRYLSTKSYPSLMKVLKCEEGEDPDWIGRDEESEQYLKEALYELNVDCFSNMTNIKARKR